MVIRGYTQGYASQPTGGNPRHTEGWALIEAARRMKEAQQRPDDIDAMLSAIRLNWRLWTIFQTTLAASDCDLPAEIRHNMLALSNFVDRCSVEVIADPASGKLDTLIAINREIAAGLFTPPPEDAIAATTTDFQTLDVTS